MGESLQSVFDNAQPGNGYDKYVSLNPSILYTGGVGIYEGTVMLDGNGAVIDLNHGSGIWIYADENYPVHFDIQYCTIMNGEYFGVSYAGSSTGYVTNCNFIENDIGITFYDTSSALVENCNFMSNETYGFGIISTSPTPEINYCNFWDNESGDCMENCPG